ncbi:S-layer homology domain-containing protein [Calderihabitans maritimus]|uniref:Prenyltransferase and squalene oxidase repeat-containing domain protein n=1 Tax=Calderihabitans maritimus TaxID=1246530 RepID=A0A1Z5HQI5_9FIRM|nr:S-layer homology domain-containing protein [Calderihabitans maritimus]GAW91792.1 prenyltransferase and squalene oxidase repeat-containing domain protein [Calderihabitans maritimus]
MKKWWKVLWLVFLFALVEIRVGHAVVAEDFRAKLIHSRERAVKFLHAYYRERDFRGLLDWGAVALYAAGEDVSDKKWESNDGRNGVWWRENEVRQGIMLSERSTDYQRTILGVLAAHKDPGNFGGKNLLEAVLKSQLSNGKFADTINGRGERLINAHVWAIIALYAAGEPIPEREKVIKWLVKQQNPDGGYHFDTTVEESEVDMTATALIAFALLGLSADDPPVQKALKYLEQQQLDSGGFGNWGVENLESTATVIQALVALGLDPTASPWNRSGGDPVTVLLQYQLPDGSFKHVLQGGSNLMATQQGLLALTAYLDGRTVYQKLRDESLAASLTFSDLSSSHWAYEEIMELVRARILNGYPDGTFKPNRPVTRAEFTKYIVYGLEYHKEAGNKTRRFKDVSLNHWANPLIRLVLEKGLMRGKGKDVFAPDDRITGAEVMTVLVRALGLEPKALVLPAQQWYEGYLRVAREKGLLYPGFQPEQPATRAQCAYSVSKLRTLLKNQN